MLITGNSKGVETVYIEGEFLNINRYVYSRSGRVALATQTKAAAIRLSDNISTMFLVEMMTLILWGVPLPLQIICLQGQSNYFAIGENS